MYTKELKKVQELSSSGTRLLYISEILHLIYIIYTSLDLYDLHLIYTIYILINLHDLHLIYIIYILIDLHNLHLIYTIYILIDLHGLHLFCTFLLMCIVEMVNKKSVFNLIRMIYMPSTNLRV